MTGLDGRGRLVAPRDERFTLEVRADLPGLQSRGGRWIVPGRGEPLTLRRKPESPRRPGRWPSGSGRPTGRPATGSMVATGPAQFRYELPPSPSSSTFDLVGGDDWLGPLKVERVDRPSLAEIKLRVKEAGAASAGFRDVDDPRQHLVFLPDTEVELTLVGNEPIADARLTVHPGSAPRPVRVDRRTFVVRWTLREATTLEILLTSAGTGLALQARRSSRSGC